MAAAASGGQPGGGGSVRGWYIYGILPGDVESAGEAQGVGDPPGKVEIVRHGDIAALVSELETNRALGTPEDLLAHQRLLDAASAEAPVLPLRFGAVVSTREAVTDELLGPHHDEFSAALGELEGCAQFVVHGRYDEQAVLHEVLTENRQAARLREEIQSAGDPDATREQRIRLGEIISQAVSAKREADTQTAADALAPHCLSTSAREPGHELDAVNLALLAKTASQGDIEQAVSQLARDWQGRTNLRLLGPMAPYDFVVTSQPAG